LQKKKEKKKKKLSTILVLLGIIVVGIATDGGSGVGSLRSLGALLLISAATTPFGLLRRLATLNSFIYTKRQCFLKLLWC
jgi:TRAP-type mannitol/chloroaromatic compound transport system permease large subunit